jgi:hypothetical protein
VDVLIDRQGEMAAVDDHEEVADDLADLVVRLSQEELPSGFGKELPLGFTGSWNCTKKSTPSIRGEKTFFYLRCEAEAAPIEDGAAFASGLEDAKYWQEMRTHSSSPTITGFCRRGSRLRGSVCPTGTVNACAAALAAAVGQGARQLAFSAALVAAKLLFAHPGTQGLADRVRLESYGRWRPRPPTSHPNATYSCVERSMRSWQGAISGIIFLKIWKPAYCLPLYFISKAKKNLDGVRVTMLRNATP